MHDNHSMAWKLTLKAGALAMMCALDLDTAARVWVLTVPNLAVPATALGFTLITAANRNRR